MEIFIYFSRSEVFFFKTKCDDGSQQKHAENPQRMSMQHGHKYSPFFKTTSKAKQPPSPTHPPFVSLLRNNLEQFLNFTLQENQMAGRWARLPKHRRSRPNFWPSLSDRPHQMFVLAGRAPNLCRSQNTERAFHFAPANALEDWEPKLAVPQPGWSLCCVVGKQGCN